MSPHKAASVGILTSSLVLIALLALGIIGSNKDKNDRYAAATTGNTGEGRSATKRHKKRINKSKSLKRNKN
jgi:hypothetical protein